MAMKSWGESRPDPAFGRIGDPESPTLLGLETGLDDDRRQHLTRGHSVYRFALVALVWQDRWSAAEHRDQMTALVGAWPLQRGQRQVRRTEGWGAHLLRREGATDAEVAATLALDVDTLRRRGTFEEGEAVWREQIEELGRSDAPLPRVYDAGRETPPMFTWVNLPLGSMRRSREALAIECRVHAKLAEMRGEPTGWEIERARRPVEERYCETCRGMAKLDHFAANPAHEPGA